MVASVTLNTVSTNSSIFEFWACSDPKHLDPPRLVASTTSTHDLEWAQPKDLGGCAITGYKLYRDAGDGTDPIVIDSADVEGDPYINSHQVTTFPANPEGLTFRYQLEAITVEGSVLSEIVGYALAGVPVDPTSAPESDDSYTSSNRIRVTIDENFYNDVADNYGSSAILSYSIEMDDGMGGPFKALYGNTVDSLSTSHQINSGIVEGRTYRFRWRAKNSVGWTNYSPIGYILAADVPDAPQAPVFDNADETQITLTFKES